MDMLPTPPPSYAKVPGSFDSIARSIRLHMLMDAACKDGGPYPSGEWAPRPGGVRHGRWGGLAVLLAGASWWLGCSVYGEALPGRGAGFPASYMLCTLSCCLF